MENTLPASPDLLTSLPPELLEAILAHLPPLALKRFGRCCRVARDSVEGWFMTLEYGRKLCGLLAKELHNFVYEKAEHAIMRTRTSEWMKKVFNVSWQSLPYDVRVRAIEGYYEEHRAPWLSQEEALYPLNKPTLQSFAAVATRRLLHGIIYNKPAPDDSPELPPLEQLEAAELFKLGYHLSYHLYECDKNLEAQAISRYMLEWLATFERGGLRGRPEPRRPRREVLALLRYDKAAAFEELAAIAAEAGWDDGRYVAEYFRALLPRRAAPGAPAHGPSPKMVNAALSMAGDIRKELYAQLDREDRLVFTDCLIFLVQRTFPLHLSGTLIIPEEALESPLVLRDAEWLMGVAGRSPIDRTTRSWQRRVAAGQIPTGLGSRVMADWLWDTVVSPLYRFEESVRAHLCS